MTESEYMLVSNLAKLNSAASVLSGVLFFDNDPRQKPLREAVRRISKLSEEIHAELDGKIEEDPEEPPKDN